MVKNRSKRGGRSGFKRQELKPTPTSDHQRKLGHERKSVPARKSDHECKTEHKRKCEYQRADRALVAKTTGRAGASGSSLDHLGQSVIPPSTSPPRELLPTTPLNHFAPCLPELQV